MWLSALFLSVRLWLNLRFGGWFCAPLINLQGICISLFSSRFCAGSSLDSLTLPGTDLIRVHLVTRRDLLHRLHRYVAPQRLKRYLSLEIP